MKEDDILKPLTAVLIDDEAGALEVLSRLLERVGNVTVLAMEQNPNLGLRQIMIHKPDMIFLDVHMEPKNGIALLKQINELSVDSHVVFVTGYDDYTFEAFKNGASDYLVKPVSFDELSKTVSRVTELLTHKDKLKDQPKVQQVSGNENVADEGEVSLHVRLSKGKGFLDVKNILYLKASGSYTEILLRGGQKEVSTRGLWLLERELPSSFLKIHRSTVVNTHYVDSIIADAQICVVKDTDSSHELTISKACIEALEEFLQQK